MKKIMITQVFRIIKYFEFVIMCMSEKLSCYSRFISVNDSIIITAPNFQAIGMTRRYMSDYMHFFSIELGRLQFVNKPLQFSSRISAI